MCTKTMKVDALLLNTQDEVPAAVVTQSKNKKMVISFQFAKLPSDEPTTHAAAYMTNHSKQQREVSPTHTQVMRHMIKRGTVFTVMLS